MPRLTSAQALMAETEQAPSRSDTPFTSQELAASVPAVNLEEILFALQALGKDDGTEQEARQARILQGTLPFPTLLPTLTMLWQKEEARRRRRSKAITAFAAALAVLILALLVWEWFFRNEINTDPERYRWQILLFILVPLSSVFLHPLSQCEKLSRVQLGIVRVCFSHPRWQLTPLFIEMLPLTPLLAQAERTAPAVYGETLQALLTTLLPLWCQEDTASLTARQRRILLDALKRVASRGVGLDRNVAAPTAPLSEAEALFCLAVLNALRRGSGTAQRLDRKTRMTLTHLPCALHADDPYRQYVQEAAQALLARING